MSALVIEGNIVGDTHADVLLVTATKVETAAVLAAFGVSGQQAAPEHVNSRVYFNLGKVNGASVKMTQCEMGSGGLGASQQAVEDGIATVSPVAVIMVGIAFGVSEEKQRIGDVLVTEQLRLYDLQRVGATIVLRGDKPHASTWLLNLLKSSEVKWGGNAALRFGPILTGDKLVDNIDYRDQLRAFEPEAVGGEMEGAGLYVACQTRKVDWILVKGICDWADGKKGVNKEERQALAAKNAAEFVVHALRFVKVDWSAQRGTRQHIHAPSASVDAPPRRPSSLPYQPLFFGREKELADIADAIAPESRTWGVLIDGPGGIGKTALAVRAAYVAPEEDFDRKIFLSAKVRELKPTGEQKLDDFMLPNFIALLTELACELGDKELARLPEDQRANAVRRLLTDKRALIVIDNVETFPEPERIRLGQFLGRLPTGCKAIVTSRRRTDVDARILRLDRLAKEDALALIDALAETNPRLSKAGPDARLRLYESTGGNPLLLRWTAGQVGRRGSECRTVDEACAFLAKAPPSNDPLEYVFGDLLDTFTESEMAVLAALVHFTLPAAVIWVADVAELSKRQAQTALEDLADRALLVGDPEAKGFVLSPLTASYLRRRRPEAVGRTANRLTAGALALVLENGDERHERFPILEAAWPALAASLPVFLQGDNVRLQSMCDSLGSFLNFSGRWDERLWLEAEAEARAVAAGDFRSAGWRAQKVAFTHFLRGGVEDVMACAARAAVHWEAAGCGAREQATVSHLLGLGYKLAKEYTAALDAVSRSLALFRSIDPASTEVADRLNELADLERLVGNWDAAETHFREALRIAEQLSHTEGLALYLGNRAELAVSRNDLPAAEQLARDALARAEGLGRLELVGFDCYQLAKALARQGKPADGLPYARRAVDIFSRLRLADDLANAEAALFECTQAEQAPKP